MNIFAIVGVGVTAAAASAMLRRLHGEFGLFVSLAASAVILGAVIVSLDPLLELLGELAEETGTQSQYIGILMKALAVCVITRLASECCRDSGESAIAAKIELAGKAAVLLVAVPLFRAILGIVRGLIV
ncbi:MAG: stage III sporulation protein AD [Ruminiclostridium sp.]|nr:stage III sporulation protein AD [Ruminiclostridium sp.]